MQITKKWKWQIASVPIKLSHLSCQALNQWPARLCDSVIQDLEYEALDLSQGFKF
jgi:hypothetical protein